jgi:hypothetical protein
LWPTADNLAWALLLWLTASLAGLAALNRRAWRAAPLHVLSGGLLGASLLTYDGMIPVVAMTGIPYWLARRDRRALTLAVLDLAIAAGYGVWRLWFASIPASGGLEVHRTTGQLIAREGHLLSGSWATFRTLCLPGGGAGIALISATCLAIFAAIVRRPAVRRPLAGWLAVAIGSAAFVGISLSVYITANNLYVPQPWSLFNRMNVAAAPAYCLGFVALLTALGIALRALASTRAATRPATISAIIITVAFGLLIVVHQYKYSRSTQRSYALAWKAEGIAMRGIRAAIAKIPDRSPYIVSFGHPIWEQRFIPVFASNWDLQGAIADETRDDPPGATPFFPGFVCEKTGLANGAVPLAGYRDATPLWFVDAVDGAARHIVSEAGCREAVKQLTPLPFFDPAGLTAG